MASKHIEKAIATITDHLSPDQFPISRDAARKYRGVGLKAIEEMTKRGLIKPDQSEPIEALPMLQRIADGDYDLRMRQGPYILSASWARVVAMAQDFPDSPLDVHAMAKRLKPGNAKLFLAVAEAGKNKEIRLAKYPGSPPTVAYTRSDVVFSKADAAQVSVDDFLAFCRPYLKPGARPLRSPTYGYTRGARLFSVKGEIFVLRMIFHPWGKSRVLSDYIFSLAVERSSPTVRPLALAPWPLPRTVS